MKKITALLTIFLISLGGYAQDEVNTSFASQMNTIFGQLDKTRIPHAILLDYGMEFTNVPAYNGTLTDSTYSSATSIKQIYKTLLSSRITVTTPDMITPTVFDANWNNNRTEGVISLCGLFYRYSQIAQNATTNNKITYTGGKFYDKTVNGVWQNPYEVLQTFVMAPAIEQYGQLSFQVKLPAELFYTNQSSAISSIAIDFDNGLGYQAITMDQMVPVAYTTTGMKTWKYKLTLNNGTSLYNQSQIQIGNDDGTFTEIPLPLPPVCETCKSSTSTSLNCDDNNKLCVGAITASTAYLGKYGKVKITVDYAIDRNHGINKPLIVAEGFDLGIILNPEKAYGSNTYSGTFKPSLINSGTTLRNLIYEYYRQYDIIYVDWDNGVDHMQRNAYALEEVIEWVNAQKVLSGSTTKNVVLGQSMGGVIARYALADMEQRGIDHQTSLFISHDAPQQGANIPVSLQYMYRHLTKQYLQIGYAPAGLLTLAILEDSFGVSDYLSILDAPASRQLLKNSINSDYSVSTTAHTAFFDELKNKGLPNSGGYPAQCRNIALSNGSECGETQNFMPGDDIVNFTYNKGLSFWGDLASMIYLPYGGAIGGTLLNPKLYAVGALGSLPGHSKFNVNFVSRALYDSAESEIYKGKISYTKKIAWLFNVTINITDVSKSQPSGILPLDTYGGGYYDTKIIAGSVNINGLYIRDRFSFIPTTSALDIGKRNVVLDDSDYKKSYVGAIPLQAPKNSPFVNYITDFDKSNPNSNKNKSHISFNSRNGDWLASELNSVNNPNISPESANCSYMCGGNAVLQISGNDFICDSGNYSVPSGAPYYNWTITQGGSLVSFTGNGTSNIVLTVLPNKSGQVTISLNMGDSAKCGIQSLTKTIWVGRPSFNVPRAPSEEESCDLKYHYIKYIITNRQQLETYSIQVFTTGVKAVFIANDRIQFNVPKGYSGLLEFSVVGSNSCGSTSYYVENLINSCGTNNNTAKNISLDIYPKQTENINSNNFINQNIESVKEEDVQVESVNLTGKLFKKGNGLIYPNPTDGFFRISLDRKSDGVLSVINMAGINIYKGDFKNQDELDVDIQNQARGTYIVSVVIDGQKFTRKVIRK